MLRPHDDDVAEEWLLIDLEVVQLDELKRGEESDDDLAAEEAPGLARTMRMTGGARPSLKTTPTNRRSTVALSLLEPTEGR